MSTATVIPGSYTVIPGSYVEDGIEYPQDDGLPMADNSPQFDWIQLIHQNLTSAFIDSPNVVVIGNMLWYPVRGENKTRRAPDVMVVFGRPKVDRGSYIQWLEDGVAPQVAFEIMSPCNTPAEMKRKLAFYDRHGVEEYYIYDPESFELSIWLRDGEHLQEQPPTLEFISPKMQVRFENTDLGLKLYRPDGKAFTTRVDADRELMVKEQARATEERKRIAEERKRVSAEQKRIAAERDREAVRQQLTDAQAEIEALRQKLQQAGLQ